MGWVARPVPLHCVTVTREAERLPYDVDSDDHVDVIRHYYILIHRYLGIFFRDHADLSLGNLPIQFQNDISIVPYDLA